jgi:hypothetical protein
MQYDFNPDPFEMSLYGRLAEIMERLRLLPDNEEARILQQDMLSTRQTLNRYLEEHPIMKRPLNITDMPQFEYIPLPAASDGRRFLWAFGVMLFLNIIGFLTAHIAFLKYDVR